MFYIVIIVFYIVIIVFYIIIVIKFTKNYQALANFKVMSVEWTTFLFKGKKKKRKIKKNKEEQRRIKEIKKI